MLNGLPDINSIITEGDRWWAIRSAEDKIMQENSYMLCRIYREYMSLLEKKGFIMGVNLLINKTLPAERVIDTITLPNIKEEDDITVTQEDTMLYLKIADALNVTCDIICDVQTNDESLTSYIVNMKITFSKDIKKRMYYFLTNRNKKKLIGIFKKYYVHKKYKNKKRK
jgi:hypothetical protein